jgi:hypothetical protein
MTGDGLDGADDQARLGPADHGVAGAAIGAHAGGAMDERQAAIISPDDRPGIENDVGDGAEEDQGQRQGRKQRQRNAADAAEDLDRARRPLGGAALDADVLRQVRIARQHRGELVLEADDEFGQLAQQQHDLAGKARNHQGAEQKDGREKQEQGQDRRPLAPDSAAHEPADRRRQGDRNHDREEQHQQGEDDLGQEPEQHHCGAGSEREAEPGGEDGARSRGGRRFHSAFLA